MCDIQTRVFDFSAEDNGDFILLHPHTNTAQEWAENMLPAGTAKAVLNFKG